MSPTVKAVVVLVVVLALGAAFVFWYQRSQAQLGAVADKRTDAERPTPTEP